MHKSLERTHLERNTNPRANAGISPVETFRRNLLDNGLATTKRSKQVLERSASCHADLYRDLYTHPAVKAPSKDCPTYQEKLAFLRQCNEQNQLSPNTPRVRQLKLELQGLNHQLGQEASPLNRQRLLNDIEAVKHKMQFSYVNHELELDKRNERLLENYRVVEKPAKRK